MALIPIVRQNVSRDVQCCFKYAVISARKVTRFNFGLHLVPSQGIRNNGMGVRSASEWAQVVALAIGRLRQLGYAVDGISLPEAQNLMRRPLQKTTDKVRLNIAVRLPRRYHL